MLGPFNRVPALREKADQWVALIVALIVLALRLLTSVLPALVPPIEVERPVQTAQTAG